MKKFGIRTEGLEQIFEDTIVNYLKESERIDFTFLEIGAAGCVSLKSFYKIIKENINHFVIIGLDLCDGWSLDWSTILSFEDLGIRQEEEIKRNTKNNVWLQLTNEPREWIQQHFIGASLDVCFIDGCHGSKCVTEDFNIVSPKMKSGGIVMFHDSGEEETGTDWQGHCNEYINVRKAILDLGLDGKNEEWEFIADIKGSRANGGYGNGLWIVQKK